MGWALAIAEWSFDIFLGRGIFVGECLKRNYPNIKKLFFFGIFFGRTTNHNHPHRLAAAFPPGQGSLERVEQLRDALKAAKEPTVLRFSGIDLR